MFIILLLAPIVNQYLPILCIISHIFVTCLTLLAVLMGLAAFNLRYHFRTMLLFLHLPQISLLACLFLRGNIRCLFISQNAATGQICRQSVNFLTILCVKMCYFLQKLTFFHQKLLKMCQKSLKMRVFLLIFMFLAVFY